MSIIVRNKMSGRPNFKYLSAAILVIAVLLMPALALSEQTDVTVTSSDDVLKGLVIYEGSLILPPYEVKDENGRIFINDLEVMLLRRRPFPDRDRGAAFRRPAHFPQQQQASNRLESHIRHGGMIICGSNTPVVFATMNQAMELLEILYSSEERQSKDQAIHQAIPLWRNPEHIATLIDTFNPSPDLDIYMYSLKQDTVRASDKHEELDRSIGMIAFLTFGGFLLAVWAFGIMLSCRPPLGGKWRGLNESKFTQPTGYQAGHSCCDSKQLRSDVYCFRP